MPENKVVLIGASCEATGHPSSCTEPAPGTVENTDGNDTITLNGKPLADHGDKMHFPSHAHKYSDINSDGAKECHDNQSHDLVPDQNPVISIDGNPVMRVADSTTDPGSGGTAEIKDSGGNSVISHKY